MRATYLAIAVVLFSTAASHAQEGLQWHFDLDSAKRAAAQTNRPILVHFWSPSCAPCVKLEQEVYSRPEVKRELEATFVLARLNVEDYPATAANFGVKSWPADVILAPDGQFVTVLKCPLVANQYLAQLGQFGRRTGELAAAGQIRADLAQNSAANMPSGATAANRVGAAAATSILQTSAHGPAGQASPATGAAGSSQNHWGGTVDRIERYDFRSAPHANVPPPQIPLTQGQPPAHAGVQQSLAPQVQPAMAQSYDMVPALAAPPVGLAGSCPVQLHRVRQFTKEDPRYKFTKGDPRLGVVHRGRTYLFSGPAEQQEFLRDPDRYSPVLGGNDPVLFFDEGRQVDGDRGFGCFVGERIYLFASRQSLDKFLAENDASRNMARPNRYAEAIYQAENPGRGIMR
jgi:thiol-disulfide isomerase/thioredoxin